MAQVWLTDYEKRRLPLGNQHTDRRHKSIVKWQVVKGAAVECDVNDWTAKVDPALTYEENIELMERYGFSGDGGPTLRHAPVKVLEKRG